uniref:Uncharacterized protein n=1 Tax=viral metagenome TaxID=1070528 RepID=A0A6C0E4V6_9ZZZZ
MSSLKGPSPDKGETIVIAITTHGAVLTKRADSGEVIPENFVTPVKIIKYSAVAFGVCNIVNDKTILFNIDHLIKEFDTRQLNWDTMTDEEIVSTLESITYKYKDYHKRSIEHVTQDDIDEWSKSKKEIDKEMLYFCHNAHLGHIINAYDAGDELTDKAYTLGGISDEAASSGDAIYSDKILLFNSSSTIDLYDELAGDNPGVILSDLIETLIMQEDPVSRIVIIDFTCNDTLGSFPITDEEKCELRDESNKGRVKLGGKKNTKKSKHSKKYKKSTNKYKKIKKSRKSRRHK